MMAVPIQPEEWKLPRLPFDDPGRSAERLIEWAAPLLTEEELCKQRHAVREFAEKDGPSLQAILNHLREEEENQVLYRLIPYWEGWYLTSREPLPVHVNPFYLFAGNALPQGENPWRLAARLALAAASFCLDLDSGKVSPDEFNGEPLCMRGYETLFRTSRRACLGQDHLVRGSPHGDAGRSALVLSGGRLFLLDLVSPEGKLRSLDDTENALESIASASPHALPVGLITCLPRNDAVKGRRLLLEGGEKNEKLLSLAEESLFALRLDGPCSPGLEGAARHFLFDGGKNGWYEKSFQIIVTADGKAGLNFEHSVRDGTHVGRLVKEMLWRASSIDGKAGCLAQPKPLSFDVSVKFKSFLKKCSVEARILSDSRRQNLFIFRAFGRERVKAGGVSPDAFVQIAMLLAERKLWGETRSVYESVQLRRFSGGRTEGNRPLTPEAVRFLSAMSEGKKSAEILRTLLTEAGDAHGKRIAECLAGRGVEGHLGLLLGVWRERGREAGVVKMPEIYSSPAWTKLTSCALSTSTTPGEGLALAGYGPVQRGGLGVRYLSRPDRFIFHISSWAEDGPLGKTFADRLEESFEAMGRLL